MNLNQLFFVILMMFFDLIYFQLPIKSQTINSDNKLSKRLITVKTTENSRSLFNCATKAHKTKQVSATNRLKLIIPPNVGTPKGNRTAAATRTRNPKYLNINPPLTALFQNENKDFTLSSYPTFWFYVPYEAKNIKEIKFQIRNWQSNTTLYRTDVSLKENFNIVKITVPQEAQFALENNSLYRWDLILFFQENNTDIPYLEVNGYIRKLPIETEAQNDLENLSGYELYEFYFNNDIWYDAINQLGELYFNNLQDEKLKIQWFTLLQKLNLKEVSESVLLY